MPALVAAIGAVLIQLLRVWALSILGRVLATIGLGIFAYTVAVPSLMDYVSEKFQGLPPFLKESAGAAGIDVFFTIIISAYAVKAVSRVFIGKSGGQ